MPVSLHGEEMFAPEKEMAPEATEVNPAYLEAPAPRVMPLVLKSMYDIVFSSRTFFNLDFFRATNK